MNNDFDDSLYDLAFNKNKKHKKKKFDNPQTDDKGFFTVQGDYYINDNNSSGGASSSVKIESPSEDYEISFSTPEEQESSIISTKITELNDNKIIKENIKEDTILKENNIIKKNFFDKYFNDYKEIIMILLIGILFIIFLDFILLF